MKLGLMQPYFFPYLGHFELINYTDFWVVLDTVQYIRRGWMNRNRILHLKDGWQYIVVPVKKQSRETIIKDIEISPVEDWRDRILNQIKLYEKHTPTHYARTRDLVRECFATKTESLSRLNVHILERICEHLGISFRYNFLSEMDLDLSGIQSSGEWALRVAKGVGAETYVNPVGGASLYESGLFAQEGIKLEIREFSGFEYGCNGFEFQANLSIIDVLMWNEPNKVSDVLKSMRST